VEFRPVSLAESSWMQRGSEMRLFHLSGSAPVVRAIYYALASKIFDLQARDQAHFWSRIDDC
jgi:hypothetical protein